MTVSKGKVLRMMTDSYESQVVERNRLCGRTKAIERGMDDPPPEPVGHIALDALDISINWLLEQMQTAVAGSAVYEWLMGVPGINSTLGCRLLGVIPMDGPNCIECAAKAPLVKELGHFAVCHKCSKVLVEGEFTMPSEKTKLKLKCAKCDIEMLFRTWIRRCTSCGKLGHDFSNFSELRVFAGICPGRNKLQKEVKSPFCTRLKTSGYVAFVSMCKAEAVGQNSDHRPNRFYGEIYANWRNTYAHRHGVGKSGAEFLMKSGQAHLILEGIINLHAEGWIIQVHNGEKWVDRDKKFDPTVDILYRESKHGKEKSAMKDKCRIRLVKPHTKVEYPDKRQHLMSKNKLLDVFLYHLWEQWRKAEGWPTRRPYAVEKLGHHEMYDPADFSSPTFAAKKIKKHVAVDISEWFAEA